MGIKRLAVYNHWSKGSDCSYNTSDEDGENPRPVKRRKLPLSPTDNTLTPPNEPTSVDDDQYYLPRAFQSPSTTAESAPDAEHQDQGFPQRTRIGNVIMYFLGFLRLYSTVTKGELFRKVGREASKAGAGKLGEG